MSLFSLRLGATVPNFDLATTKGDFKLHDFIISDPSRPWTVLMSHPRAFTPVCTTELGRAERLASEFAKRGAKLIAVSCDSVSQNIAWSEDITYREKLEGRSLSYPIIGDTTRKVVVGLGMLDPLEVYSEVPLPARALLILDVQCKVRFALLYPASTGRNFDEVLRVLDSLNVAKENDVATAVNWKLGDKIIIPPNMPHDLALVKFHDVHCQSLPSGNSYMRTATLPS